MTTKSRHDITCIHHGTDLLSGVSRTLILAIALCVAISLCLVPNNMYAQPDSIIEKESHLRQLHGLEKVIALNDLTSNYLEFNLYKAKKMGRQAVKLAEDIISPVNLNSTPADRIHLLTAYYQYAIVHYETDDFISSRNFFYRARSYAAIIHDDRYDESINEYIESVQTLIDQGDTNKGIIKKSLEKIRIGEAVTDLSSGVRIQAEIKLAESKEKNKDWRGAINHYKNALDRLKDKGDSHTMTDIQLKVASLLDSLNQPQEAQEFLGEAIAKSESQLIAFDSTSILPSSTEEVQTGNELSTQDKSKASDMRAELKSKAKDFAARKDFEKSLEYFTLWQELSNKVISDSLQEMALNKQRQSEIKLLKQQKLIADREVLAIEQEKERQVRMRNYTLMGLLAVLISALVTLYFYVTKKRDHKKLTVAYSDLDKTKTKLETAEKRITNLLKQQVSGDIASTLISSDKAAFAAKHFVCIMFLDIRDFTPIAEKMSPEELIQYQNNIFGFMIDVVQKHHGNINQLLGDGFMATFGAPISHGNDCQNAYSAALEILNEVDLRYKSGSIRETKIGIGLHAGEVVTGNVGNEIRKQYSVTGNPVIIASRVEQLNKKFGANLIITEAVYQRLDEDISKKGNGVFDSVRVKGRSKPINILIQKSAEILHEGNE